MKKYTPEILVAGLLLALTTIRPSPVLFPYIPDSLAGIKQCSSKTTTTTVINWNEDLNEITLKKISESSEASARERIESINCIRRSLSAKEISDSFLQLFTSRNETENTMIELNFNLMVKHEESMTFKDRILLTDYFKEKREFYDKLNQLTWREISAKKTGAKNPEKEFAAVYYAILHSRVRFYEEISPEFRKTMSQFF